MFSSLHTFSFLALGLALFTLPARASGGDEIPTSASALTELETRAAQAEPRERCFLYTELLHGWTEVAGHSFAAGDESAAVEAMQHADTDALHLKEAIGRDSKRLKNAEMIVEHSVQRLSDILRVSTREQHDTVQAVLRHVSNVHDDLLAAVFSH